MGSSAKRWNGWTKDDMRVPLLLLSCCHIATVFAVLLVGSCFFFLFRFTFLVHGPKAGLVSLLPFILCVRKVVVCLTFKTVGGICDIKRVNTHYMRTQHSNSMANACVYVCVYVCVWHLHAVRLFCVTSAFSSVRWLLLLLLWFRFFLGAFIHSFNLLYVFIMYKNRSVYRFWGDFGAKMK